MTMLLAFTRLMKFHLVMYLFLKVTDASDCDTPFNAHHVKSTSKVSIDELENSSGSLQSSPTPLYQSDDMPVMSDFTLHRQTPLGKSDKKKTLLVFYIENNSGNSNNYKTTLNKTSSESSNSDTTSSEMIDSRNNLSDSDKMYFAKGPIKVSDNERLPQVFNNTETSLKSLHINATSLVTSDSTDESSESTDIDFTEGSPEVSDREILAYVFINTRTSLKAHRSNATSSVSSDSTYESSASTDIDFTEHSTEVSDSEILKLLFDSTKTSLKAPRSNATSSLSSDSTDETSKSTDIDFTEDSTEVSDSEILPHVFNNTKTKLEAPHSNATLPVSSDSPQHLTESSDSDFILDLTVSSDNEILPHVFNNTKTSSETSDKDATSSILFDSTEDLTQSPDSDSSEDSIQVSVSETTEHIFNNTEISSEKSYNHATSSMSSDSAEYLTESSDRNYTKVTTEVPDSENIQNMFNKTETSLEATHSEKTYPVTFFSVEHSSESFNNFSKFYNSNATDGVSAEMRFNILPQATDSIEISSMVL